MEPNEEKCLFDKIVDDRGKVFDEQMAPLVRSELISKFQEYYRNGRKVLIQIEKEINELLSNFENIDMNKFMELSIRKDVINTQCNKCLEQYEKLFGKRMNISFE